MLGTGKLAERTAAHLLDHPGVGLHPVAAFGHGGTWSLARLPVVGRLELGWHYVYENNVRHAIVTEDAAKELGFDEVLRRADRQLRFVQFLPDLGGLPSNSVVATPLGATLALEVRNQLASGTNRAWKRAMDLTVAVLLLLVLGLPLLLIALLIRLDSKGPALYLSPRVGRYGKTFRCAKFRTMYVDAEQSLEALLDTDPAIRAEYQHFRKLSNDPRVTRMGRVLRRLSLDEFPQLLNVVRGQMSLVGPRPYLVTELADMGPDRDLIFLARPGMTGYWQVEARNDVDFAERQSMEAHYIRNWSVWWDIEILLRTPLAMLGPDGK
jgi:Undecaprenyl-phosphate galactose phosphotransferase WbaP